jgi:hypothetical protein
MQYSKDNVIRAFSENNIITDTNAQLHSREEVDTIIKFLDEANSTKDLFYYLERICFNTCIHAIWNVNVENGSSEEWYELAKKVTKNSTEITHVMNHIDSMNRQIISDDIDDILNRAADTNRSLVIVSTPGTVIHDKLAYTMVWPYFEKNKNALMMAHIMDNAARKDSSYYWSIHPQFFAVNLELYRKLGRPKFNTISEDSVAVGQRSEENVHDNYTPLWLTDNGDKQPAEGLKFSWASNLINVGLANGHDIINVPRTIRNYKKFYYPSTTDVFKELNRENDLLIDNFHGGWNFVYIFNTEQLPNNFTEPCCVTVYKDRQNFPMTVHGNLKEFINTVEVDSYVSVSSGFAGDRWSYLFGFDHDRMCYFDINSASLFYKKMLFANWAGPKHQLLGDFLYEYGNVENSNLFFEMINLARPNNIEKWRKDINNYCQSVINLWGVEEFQTYFDKVKQSRQFYFCSDILHNPRAMASFNLLRQKNYQLIFASNILDNRVLFHQNDFSKEKIFNAVADFFDRMPPKTIYIGNNITGLYNAFYDRKFRVTNILIKE